jgi:hypothetical protein
MKDEALSPHDLLEALDRLRSDFAATLAAARPALLAGEEATTRKFNEVRSAFDERKAGLIAGLRSPATASASPAGAVGWIPGHIPIPKGPCSLLYAPEIDFVIFARTGEVDAHRLSGKVAVGDAFCSLDQPEPFGRISYGFRSKFALPTERAAAIASKVHLDASWLETGSSSAHGLSLLSVTHQLVVNSGASSVQKSATVYSQEVQGINLEIEQFRHWTSALSISLCEVERPIGNLTVDEAVILVVKSTPVDSAWAACQTVRAEFENLYVYACATCLGLT